MLPCTWSSSCAISNRCCRPLGWTLPDRRYIVAALLGGVGLRHRGRPLLAACATNVHRQFRVLDMLLLGLIFGPILEESIFRGCLLPLLAQTTGNVVAVVLTAFVFALFHGPTDLPHWVSFSVTGVAYGWIRVASRSTTAGALMHAAYNLSLFLLS